MGCISIADLHGRGWAPLFNTVCFNWCVIKWIVQKSTNHLQPASLGHVQRSKPNVILYGYQDKCRIILPAFFARDEHKQTSIRHIFHVLVIKGCTNGWLNCVSRLNIPGNNNSQRRSSTVYKLGKYKYHKHETTWHQQQLKRQSKEENQ